MAMMARLPGKPHLLQALPVTLQPLICAYKAMHQLGGQLQLLQKLSQCFAILE